MNACRNHLADLVDAAEGRPVPALDVHLADCPGCRARLVELREGLELAAPAPAPAPGPWLAARIRARAETRKARRAQGLLLASGLAAVAGAFLVVMGWPGGDPGRPVDAPAELWAAVAQDLDRSPAALSAADGLALESLGEVTPSELIPAEIRVYGLEADALDPSEYDPWAPALGLDLDAELAGASEAELTALLNRLPG